MRYWSVSHMIPTFQLGEEITKVALALIEQEPMGKNTENLMTTERFLHQERKWDEVTSAMMQVASTWIEQVYDCDFRITQMWGNKTSKKESHHKHSHTNSFVSCVFHLSESNAKIKFSMPSIWDFQQVSNHNILDVQLRPDLVESVSEYNTEAGTMIVFPSWLKHEVTTHQLEQPRYSISCNLFPTGTLGNSLAATFLDLR